MNLEHVSSGKSTYSHTQIRPQRIQLPLFPKKSTFSPYRISNAHIEDILRKITARGLCGRSQVKDYLRKKLRQNCQPNTIRTIGSTILLFLAFFKRRGYEHLSEIDREQVSAFVEYEQDRGMAPISVDGRLKALYAFLNYLVEHDVIAA